MRIIGQIRYSDGPLVESLDQGLHLLLALWFGQFSDSMCSSLGSEAYITI